MVGLKIEAKYVFQYRLGIVVKMLYLIIVITVITSCIIHVHVPIIPHSVISNKLNKGIQHIYIHILVVHDLVKNIYTGLKNCTIIFTEYF